MAKPRIALAILPCLMATAWGQTCRAAGDSGVERDLNPFLAKYCVKCHSGEKPKAGITLAPPIEDASIPKSRKTWDRVLEALDTGTMPPEGKPRPTEAESKKTIAWLQTRLSSADCRLQDDPGRVTMRRLNRNEYRNTVRDLLGIDFEPTEDFPSDDVGYGFDNIGDVLTLPPILMEKYVAAAEAIADRAIVDDNPVRPRVKNLFLPRDLKVGEAYKRNGRKLASNATVGISHEFPSDGDYLFKVQAFGEQAGPEPTKMDVKIDGNTVRTIDVKAAGEFESYDTRFKTTKGTHRVEVAFVNDYYKPDDPDPKKRDRNLIVRRDFWEITGPIPKDDGRLPESHKRIVFRKPRGYGDVDAIRAILERLATRAYRRPATAEDVTRLMRMVELAKNDGERIEVGLRLALQAILISPHFLFRVELDPADSAGTRFVDNYELASRLSYFIWSSMPDEALMESARSGKIGTPAGLEEQVRRMLSDPKAKALTDNFAGQWLQLRNLKALAPDKVLFPQFDEPLRAAMRRETELFFESIVKEDRPILDFLDSDYTFVNDRLARHYGLPQTGSAEFRRITFPDKRRGGLMSQASILAVTSNPTRTSPVKRGKWVLEQLLGSPPPPPPPEVPDLKEDNGAQLTGSLRQRMEQHRANPNCATCHSKMDPLGFGLENFDAIGSWRDKDGTFPIDSSGVLPGGKPFQGPSGLREVLRSKGPEFTHCLSEKLLTYGLGRGLEEPDRCAVDKIAEAVTADGNKFSRMVLEIVRSDPFRKRKAAKPIGVAGQ